MSVCWHYRLQAVSDDRPDKQVPGEHNANNPLAPPAYQDDDDDAESAIGLTTGVDTEIPMPRKTKRRKGCCICCGIKYATSILSSYKQLTKCNIVAHCSARRLVSFSFCSRSGTHSNSSDGCRLSVQYFLWNRPNSTNSLFEIAFSDWFGGHASLQHFPWLRRWIFFALVPGRERGRLLYDSSR